MVRFDGGVIPEGNDRKLAAILCADVVGYSRLMAEDEAETVRAITRCREEVERLVPRGRGRLVDFTGDNFLAEFPTATDAASCAVEVQKAMRASGTGLPAARRMTLRMGLHLGEVRVEGERIFGAGVNIAARLVPLAEPGGLCVSAIVRDQLHRGSALTFQSLGPQRLKNIPDAVEAFRAVWAEGDVSAPRPATREPSVAVLAFANMSADPDQEFFADGMAEELINALTHVEGLRVIARTSAFSFKGTNADIAAIGRRLDVEHVVEGSVRRAGNRVRITAQLIDVAGGHHLWSEVFDRSLEDVFQIQDEIARTVVEKIRPKLLGETLVLVRPTTRSPEAYELYLRAGDRLSMSDQWQTRTAVEMLSEATAIDPDYADAWARLATACCDMHFVFDPDPRWHARAKEAAQRAFALNPNGAEAHGAQARILWSPDEGFQNDAALRSCARSLELRPGSQRTLLYRGMILNHVGLLEEAQESLSAALAAQPDDSTTLVTIAQVLWFQNHYETAADYMARALERAPGHFIVHLFNSALWLYLDELERAERTLATARGLLGDEPILDANEALLWAKRGDERRALDALARAAQDKRSLGHAHHAKHHAAAAYAVLGRKEDAIEQLRTASRCGLPNHPLFATDPHLTSLQDEPAMRELMAELAKTDAEYRAEFGSDS